jgi:N-methylhydantoinase A
MPRSGVSNRDGCVVKDIVVAVDTGGTFTDVVCLRDGVVGTLKVPSTPDDPARAVLEGVRRVLGEGVAPDFVLVHGSTVATNALLERKGGRVALVTNRGFEDVLEIGRQNRPQLYALSGHRPPPLVPASLRFGVAGRMGPGGEELEPLDDAEIQALPARIGPGLDAVAVCLLHAYANPSHERRIGEMLTNAGLVVSLSSEILPEFREFERTATTVVNAYVAPAMDGYLDRIERGAGARRVRIMASAGGVMAVARARREAVHTVLSGPAGGVSGALAVARRAGFENILTFDMGGTSTDVSLCPGRALQTREFRIADIPVAVPVLDIHTVGAGGGSIARLDAGGALRVGPESAGARPGPICYGHGGAAVTVTDANVWLRRLPATTWRHGGGTGLDRDAIAGPLDALAAGMDTDRETAAEGVIQVINTAMEGALRVISVERGHDPADFTLVCFGGAGGLHATSLAERLGVPRVLVPPAPGVLSAYGMLVAPVRKDVSRTVLRSARSESAIDLGPLFEELEATALAGMGEEGLTPAAIRCVRRIDARYEGQSWELTVPAESWIENFHAAHERRFGFCVREGVVQAVSLRVEAVAEAGDAGEARFAPPPDGAGRPMGREPVHHEGRSVSAELWERDRLGRGQRIEGPAVIAEYSATLWLPPGWLGRVLDDGALLLEPS